MDYAKCDAMDVAEYILWYCENELNKPINNLRLQKTLYYVQGEYLRRYNKPLFDNDMEAWTYGVVVPYVYYSYSNFICDDITGVTRLHKDCLDDKTNPVYLKAINEATLPKLFEKGCLNIKPKIILGEFEEVKSYILITFDNFSVNKTNPQFRDCTVYIDVITHLDYWDLGNYRMRPLKIVGYIDGILDNSRLTGIGTFQFESCVMSKYDENFSGYTLKYRAIHGSDDELPESDKIV